MSEFNLRQNYVQVKPNKREVSLIHGQIVTHKILPAFSHKFTSCIRRADRLTSYIHWPRGLKQMLLELSDAGFFYTIRRDIITCFSCGLLLRNWLPQHSPWTQHALHVKNCEYLYLIKGRSSSKK